MAAGSRSFDGNDYRKRVLSAIEARGGAHTSDPFEYYDLPLGEADRMRHDAVLRQTEAVWAFWQKQRDHPKYRGLVTALLGMHEAVAPLLRDPDTRSRLAVDARQLRAQRDSARYVELDAAMERLIERFGGIPAGKVDGLRRLGEAAGLDERSVEARIVRHPLLQDVAAAPAAVPASVYRQVRGDLDELGRLLGVAPPVSLYDLLGLPPGASRADVRAERLAAAARNRALRPDRRRALVDDLLAAVTALLVDGDPDGYLDAVAQDVLVRLRPRVALVVLVEDQLGVADHEALVDEAQAAGLDRARAEGVLAELAREAGLRRPPAGPPSPQPHPRSPAAPSSAAPGAWTEPLSQARAALREGRVLQAQRLVATARQLAGGLLPPLRVVEDEVTLVLSQAQQRWREVERALLTGRFTAAATGLEELTRTAVDLPGPDNTSVPTALEQVRAELDIAAARLATAEALRGSARELALLEVARLAPDHDGVLAALRAVGVAPPTDVRAGLASGGIRISWRASTSPGPVEYTVRRADGRVLGRTSDTELEVALTGERGGHLPTYVVTARRAGIWSADASSAPNGVPPAISSLAVLPMGRRIRLVFPSPARGRAEVRRLPAGADAPPVGTLVPDPASMGELVPGMGPGLAVDRRGDEPVVRYVVLTVDDVAVAGATTVSVSLPSVSAVHYRYGRLRWQWPSDCIAVIVICRREQAPRHPYEPGVTSLPVTREQYEDDGGAQLPPERPVHVAVFATLRLNGALHAADEAPAEARRHLPEL